MDRFVGLDVHTSSCTFGVTGLDINFSSPLSDTLPLTIHIKPGIVLSDPSKMPLGFPAGKPLARITFVLSQLLKIGSTSVAYFWLPPL